MDTWAFLIIGAGAILFVVSKRKPIFLFVTGVGVGLLWGAVWAASIISGVLR